PIPTFTDASPEVVTWLAANAGKTAADAIAAVTAEHTPAIQAFNLYSFTIPGLGTLNFNSTFFIGVVLMLIVFAIQHRGILGTATAQKWIGLIVIIPMLIVGIVPLFNGKFNAENVAGPYWPGVGDNPTWTYFLGGLFIAAWSTYAFETAICYTR